MYIKAKKNCMNLQYITPTIIIIIAFFCYKYTSAIDSTVPNFNNNNIHVIYSVKYLLLVI